MLSRRVLMNKNDYIKHPDVVSTPEERDILNVVIHPRMYGLSTYQSTMMLVLKDIRRPLRFVVWKDLKTSKL